MFTDKKMEKIERYAIQSSITNTLACLNEAQRIATKREDVEALIVTAERWITVAEKIKRIDSNRQVMLGFTSELEEQEEEQHEHHD